MFPKDTIAYLLITTCDLSSSKPIQIPLTSGLQTGLAYVIIKIKENTRG